MIERRVVELRAAVSQRSLEGYATTYTEYPIKDFYERIAPGCFAEAAANADVRFLRDHNPSQIFGRTKAGTLRLKEDQHGLRFSVDLPDTNDARDLYELVKRGDIDQCSYGFTVLKDAWSMASDGLHSLRTIYKAMLYDVSAVTYPANVNTTISVSERAIVHADAVEMPPVTLLERDKELLELRWREQRDHGLPPMTEAERREFQNQMRRRGLMERVLYRG